MSLKTLPIRASARLFVLSESLLRPFRPKSGDDILVLEYRLPLGCCVHLTPAYEAIKRRHPERKIAVATRGLGLAVLRHNPFIDHLIETPDALVSPRAAADSLKDSLASRGLRPGLILTGASDQRTSIAMTAILASSARRGGFTIYPELYHHPLTNDPGTSLIANNLRMAELAGASADPLEPRVFFSPDDVAVARSLMSEVNPQGRPTIVFVTQNSGGQLTGWHIDRFTQVIRHAHESLGCEVVYVGIEKDRPAIEAIRSAAGGIGNSIAGRTSVTQVAALLAMSDAAVSLDTGTLHVARAVQTPVVVLGPSWQPPIEWLPIGVPWARILRGKDIDRRSIPKGYQLDEIEAPAVISALDELFTAYPPSQESRDQRVARSLSTVDHLKAL
jgi:ADP-heptose:LPS heptosyltransferase